MSSDTSSLREIVQRLMNAMAFANAVNRREFEQLLALSAQPAAPTTTHDAISEVQAASPPAIGLPPSAGEPLPG
jgi:hypothetical protein